MDVGADCHVVRLLGEYGDSILDGTFLSRIEGNIGIQVDQPLNVEQLLAQCMHPHGSVSQNDTLSNCISWPCQFCIRIILLVAQSPLLPHMIGQIKSHIQSPRNSDGNDFKEGLGNDLKDPFVAPLRIKVHPEVGTHQPVSQQNTNQPSTSLTLDETAQLWKSQLKTPERNIKSKELSGADVLQVETIRDNAVDFPPTNPEAPSMNGDLPRTPSIFGQRASDTSLPEIHTDSCTSEDEEEQKTPPAWANSPERNKQLSKQDGRDSLRRKAFGSPYSKFYLPMKDMFPGTKTKNWARTNSEGRFSNIYSPSPDSHKRVPRQTAAKPSPLASTPSRVRSDNIVWTAKLANMSLAAPPKRPLRPRACKDTSSSETGNPKLTEIGLETVVERSLVLRNYEMTPQLKMNTSNLAGTRFNAPPKRPAKSRDSQSTRLYHPKALTANSLPREVQAEISSSVKRLYGPVFMCFLPIAKVTQYSNFHPSSINSTPAAVLTEKTLKSVQDQGKSISDQIRSSIDDSQLEESFVPDNFTLNDLISQRDRRISDVKDEISKKKKQKKDIFNILDWLEYTRARVYESMSSEAEVRKSREEYNLDVMNVYLCFWAWFRLLGPILNGRRQRSLIVLLLRREVGITRLKKYLNANHRPISFHILFTQLSTLKPTVGDGNFTPGYGTAWDYVTRLLRGRRGPNGKTITDDIILNALMWVPPAYHTTGGPISGLQGLSTAALSDQPVSIFTASQNPKRYLLEVASTSQNVMADESVVLSSDFDEESLLKTRQIEGEDDSGFGGVTDGSNSDYMMEDSDHQNSLANAVEKLATQLESCQSEITTATRSFKFYCETQSIRQLTVDSALGPAVFDFIAALAEPAISKYPREYLGTFLYPEIEKVRFGNSKNWVRHVPRIGSWILPILTSGHWRAMMIHWELEEKMGKEGRVVKKKYVLELYDPQHHQVGSEAAVRVKPIIERIKKFLAHLCDNSECITWTFRWAHGPVQDRDDSIHCGIYTLQAVCCWYGGRHLVSQLAKPILLRREFIRQLQKVVDEKKVRLVPYGTGSPVARLSNERRSVFSAANS